MAQVGCRSSCYLYVCVFYLLTIFYCRSEIWSCAGCSLPRDQLCPRTNAHVREPGGRTYEAGMKLGGGAVGFSPGRARIQIQAACSPVGPTGLQAGPPARTSELF